MPERAWGFKSPLGHTIDALTGAPPDPAAGDGASPDLRDDGSDPSGGHEQVLPLHDPVLEEPLTDRREVGVQGRDLGGILAEEAVHRDGRAVVGLEEVPEL